MTDEELIARLREIQGQAGLFASAAADRIEALVGEWSKDGDEILSLREKVARLEGALKVIDALDPEQQINGFSENALRGLVLRMGSTARAAITTEKPHE